MEPRQNRPIGGYEGTPQERGNPGDRGFASVEVPSEAAHERHEVLSNGMEREPQLTAAAPIAPVPIVPTAVPLPVLPQAQMTASDDTALLAADEDLIEKEWVDKAKKIISETRDDPYAREKAVGRLQAEYIRKRYGRVIGGAE